MGKYPVDKRIGTIYKIQNKLNGKIYIGQTIMDVRDRWYRHCEINRGNPAECNMPIKKAILKYRKENFDFSIIEQVPRDLLNEREKYWIAFYKSNELGYNILSGGQDSSKPPKLSTEQMKDIVILYNSGKSLRELGFKYDVDHATIKHYLLIQGVSVDSNKRCRKFSQEDINEIREMAKVHNRKEIACIYKISKSYLSQILSNKCRI